MDSLWVLAGLFIFAVFMAFAFVVAFGAPYLPTLSPQISTALKLADLKPGQTLIELGSGDGRVMVAAAKQGIRVIGYELNPLLVLYSWLITRRYRGNVRIVWANFWRRPLPEADAIFTFLLPKYMKKLDTKIVQELKRWSNNADEANKSPVNPVVDFRGLLHGKSRRPGRLAKTDTKAHYRVKLVSFAFKVPGKKASSQVNGVFLYEYASSAKRVK